MTSIRTRQTLAEDLEARLRQTGERVTPARIAILSLLAHSKKPLSSEDIFSKLRTQKGDQATIYRTLRKLSDRGVVRQVNLRHGHAHYELVGGDHHHVVCRTCGTVEDFIGCDVQQLVRRARRQTRSFATIDDHAIELFGQCHVCAKKKV